MVRAWLTRDRPNRRERRHLIDPICREGRMRGMGTAEDYHRLARAAGLEVRRYQDLSHRVKRTWPTCARRVAGAVIRDPSYRRFPLGRENDHRVFAVTLLRIWLAYELGTMRYGVLTAKRPRVTPP